MMKFVLIKKKWIIFPILCLGIAFVWFMLTPSAIETGGQLTSQADENEFTINMVTGEFKSETEDGEEIESYRWDPGTIVIPKGEPVKLSIYGVNGKEHPFIIEGTDITGTVKKGEETLLNLQFNETGIYRLICTTHESIDKNGPMIAYLVVE